ncbi:hypothetical protein FNV43_RR11888 [Rhamnella rubrinervis]|uniref:Sigma factor n=1 Tax=Rhamnella rubrinervis TaxID=2594499 RepID=A0A8K0MIA2_9ROSA|nr:hypothetical protein FNV43_RR11888 [Rhamnella rubrinervis]
MGLGFRLNLKWGFPINSHSHSNLPSKRLSSSSPVRGREAPFNFARLSFLSCISEESECVCKDPLKVYTCSSAPPQTYEDISSEMEEMKMNFGKISKNSLYNMVADSQMTAGEDKYVSKTCVKECKASHFSLLMQNLGVLEETFSDSDALRLEREILLQLGRLGALKLFDTCLSRTIETSNFLDLSEKPIESIKEHGTSSKIDNHTAKNVVRSRKSKVRKSRERTLEISNIVPSQPFPSETSGRLLQKPTVSSVKRSPNFRSRRLTTSKKEAEMSIGVKMVAKLEGIRTALENETGRVVSLSCWAEAAGIDEKLLLQHLHFGWYCRDELVRSTRSLVLYLARNYRGAGIPWEDLLQAGNLGVLQGAERFDHTRGYRFSTYVQYWIRKSMSKLVARHARGIQIPCSLSKAINQIQKARKSINTNRRKYPDDDEIAKVTGLSLAKIRSASKCLRVVGSVDHKTGDVFSGKYIEFIPDMSVKSPEETVMRQHMKKYIHELLKGLDSRERQVLVLRYGFKNCQPKSLDEIGRLLQVSKEWPSREDEFTFLLPQFDTDVYNIWKGVKRLPLQFPIEVAPPHNSAALRL